MNTIIGDAPDEQRWFTRLIVFVVLQTVGFSLIALAAQIITGQITAFLALLLLATYGAAASFAQRRVREGHIQRASAVILIAALTLATTGSFLVPETLAVNLVLPFAAVAVCLPAMRVRWFVPVLVAAWASQPAMVLLSNYFAIQSASWVTPVVAALGISQTSAFVMVLFWRYHLRMTRIVERLRDAVRDLGHTRDDLEVKVDERDAALADREERFRRISDLVSDYLFEYDVTPDGRVEVTWVSEPFVRTVGYSVDALNANGGFYSIAAMEDWKTAERSYRNVLANTTDICEFRVETPTGDERWLRAYTQPIWSESDARVVRAFGALQDITEQRASEQRINDLAYFDPLTGLANRRRWQERIQQLAFASDTAAYAVLFIDLDRFKDVNDTLGYATGDRLLVAAADRLRTVVSSNDLVARVGGDEFAILLTAADGQAALNVARTVGAQFSTPFVVDEYHLRVEASIGIATSGAADHDLGSLLRQADIAMYHAKSSGVGMAMYNPSQEICSPETLQIDVELRHAIDAGDLMLHFQPIVDLWTGSIVRYETLVRWIHHSLGPVSPAVFIPIAEERGLIRAVDRWVLEAALKTVALSASMGQPVQLSINLSAISVQDASLVAWFRAKVAENGVDPEMLMVEVTETTAVENMADAAGVLKALSEMGVQIALDDFGSGYTSLSALKRLPIDTIKIDQSFVRGIGVDYRDEGVLRAVMALGNELRVATVVEGVESAKQLEWLRSVGFRHVQGFLLGRPAAPQAYLNEPQRAPADVAEVIGLPPGRGSVA